MKKEEAVSITEFFRALSLEQAKQRFPDKKEAAFGMPGSVDGQRFLDAASIGASPSLCKEASDTQIAVLSDLDHPGI